MVASESFAEFLREQLAPLGRVAMRRMFGKTGVFCDGLMFGMVTDNMLYLRVDDHNRAAFKEAESFPPLNYEKKGCTIDLTFWRAPERLFDEPDELVTWARAALAAPLTMFARAPVILGAVAIFGLYETALMALLPIWGVRVGLTDRTAAVTLSVVYIGSIALQMPIGWLSDRLSRIAVLRLCGVVGLMGALLVVNLVMPLLMLLCLLFVWGGIASGIYPVALSMTGDRFRGTELVTTNAAMIIAYGLGGLVGPALAGVAMTIWDPQGLFWLFALLFACLLATAGLTAGRPRPSGTA